MAANKAELILFKNFNNFAYLSSGQLCGIYLEGTVQTSERHLNDSFIFQKETLK